MKVVFWNSRGLADLTKPSAKTKKLCIFGPIQGEKGADTWLIWLRRSKLISQLFPRPVEIPFQIILLKPCVPAGIFSGIVWLHMVDLEVSYLGQTFLLILEPLQRETFRLSLPYYAKVMVSSLCSMQSMDRRNTNINKNFWQRWLTLALEKLFHM